MGRKHRHAIGLGSSFGSSSATAPHTPSTICFDSKSAMDVPLQAVVLADSFDRRFAPITLETPRALLPVVNIPLVSYTIDWLAAAGCSDVFVFARSHSDKISVNVEVFSSEECNSAGDALRFMQEMEIIKHDFIIVSGDVVSNMKVTEILQAHIKRRKKDPHAIMTMVFKQASPTHRTRSQEDATIIALDEDTGQMLHYQNEVDLQKFEVSTSLFTKETSAIRLRYDLIDCRIDICSPDVLDVFMDNFDFQDMRQDFVRGVLESEILGLKIYTDVISGEYAARVANLSTYVAVSRDILHRWCFPMVPDNNITGETSYKRERSSLYKENAVSLALSCKIGKDCVIGAHSQIGAYSAISTTIIGRNCKIGKRVEIIDSFLWDNVVVEEGCSIRNSIVCSNAVIHRASSITPGSLISFGVHVGPNFNQPDKELKLTLVEDLNDDWSEFDEPLQAISLGEKGQGRRWVREEDTEGDGEGLNSLIAAPSRSVDQCTAREGEEDDILFSSDEEEEDEDPMTDNLKFVNTVQEIVRSGLDENKTIDNLTLEINGAKFAFDRTFVDCASAFIPTLLTTIVPQVQSGTKKVLVAQVKKVFKKYANLIQQYVKTREDQIELIFSIQEICEDSSYSIFEPSFQFILSTLYDEDILEEESIFQWVKEQENATAEERRFVTQCKPFLTWLQEAEEDSDE